MPSPLSSFLTFTLLLLACPTSLGISHALLLLSLVLWLLHYLLLVSVVSSFPPLPFLFNWGKSIISEDCETVDHPWHSWEPHDFGWSRYHLRLRLRVKELLLQRATLKTPAGTRKEYGVLGKKHCQATHLSITLGDPLHVLKLATLLFCCVVQKTCQGLFWVESLHMGIKHEYKCSVAISEVLCYC